MGQTTAGSQQEIHFQNYSQRKRPIPAPTAPDAQQTRFRKAGSTTTIPPEYEPQSLEKPHNIKRHRDKLLKQCKDLQNRNTQLQTQLATKQNTIQVLLSAQTADKTQIHTLESKQNEPDTNKGQIAAKDVTIETLQGTIRNLRSALSHAQQTILSMTSIMDVNQKMPTVDELLIKFQSIRDQQHADMCTTLKRVIKQQHPQWQKYYVAQVVHRFTFHGLIITYNTVKDYKEKLYDTVADALNMKHTMLKSMNEDSVNEKDIEYEMHRVLRNMFGAYFKNNFEFILKRDKVLDEIMKKLGTMWSETELDEMNEDHVEQVRLYIRHCCDICWIMMLQDPVLEFYPMQWKECKENVVYDEELHRKVVGSDRKSKRVLYYVWPVISRSNDICGNYKMDVVVKDDFYGKIKEKKRKASRKPTDADKNIQNSTNTDANTVENDMGVEEKQVEISIKTEVLIEKESPQISENVESTNADVKGDNVQESEAEDKISTNKGMVTNENNEICNEQNTPINVSVESSVDAINNDNDQQTISNVSEDVESKNQSVENDMGTIHNNQQKHSDMHKDIESKNPKVEEENAPDMKDDKNQNNE